MISFSPYYGPDEKRSFQITLAKNLSPEAQYEILATVLDGRDPNYVYFVCPKCDIRSGVELVYKGPNKILEDEDIIEAICNGEIKYIEFEQDFKNRNVQHNCECLNCHHTWREDIERRTLPGLEIY